MQLAGASETAKGRPSLSNRKKKRTARPSVALAKKAPSFSTPRSRDRERSLAEPRSIRAREKAWYTAYKPVVLLQHQSDCKIFTRDVYPPTRYVKGVATYGQRIRAITHFASLSQHNNCITAMASLVPRPHPQEGERVYNVEILGCAESACSENG